MERKKIEIAVSSLNDDIFNAINNFKRFSLLPGVFVHFIHQVTNEKDYSEALNDIDGVEAIRYSRLENIGLPLSRNYGLDNCIADYLIPTDSDVHLIDGFESVVRDAFLWEPNADYFSFQSYRSFEENIARRQFPAKAYKHHLYTIRSVSSIELVIKVASFRENNVAWDIDFGLGAKFKGGLENVMLRNACDKKLTGFYIPKRFSEHNEVSSGAHVTLERVYTRTAVFCRIYGVYLGFIASFVFHLRYRVYIKNLGSFNVFRFMLKGVRDVSSHMRVR